MKNKRIFDNISFVKQLLIWLVSIRGTSLVFDTWIKLSEPYFTLLKILIGLLVGLVVFYLMNKKIIKKKKNHWQKKPFTLYYKCKDKGGDSKWEINVSHGIETVIK